MCWANDGMESALLAHLMDTGISHLTQCIANKWQHHAIWLNQSFWVKTSICLCFILFSWLYVIHCKCFEVNLAFNQKHNYKSKPLSHWFQFRDSKPCSERHFGQETLIEQGDWEVRRGEPLHFQLAQGPFPLFRVRFGFWFPWNEFRVSCLCRYSSLDRAGQICVFYFQQIAH